MCLLPIYQTGVFPNYSKGYEVLLRQQVGPRWHFVKPIKEKYNNPSFSHKTASPSKFCIITGTLSCQGGGQNWQNCPQTNAQLTKEVPLKKLNIDYASSLANIMRPWYFYEIYVILRRFAEILFTKLQIFNQQCMGVPDCKTTHWVQWWRWWACCRWTWCGSRWWRGACPTSCTGLAPCTTGGDRGPRARGKGPWLQAQIWGFMSLGLEWDFWEKM